MAASARTAAWILVAALLAGGHALRTSTSIDEATGDSAAVALTWRPSLLSEAGAQHDDGEVAVPAGDISAWGAAVDSARPGQAAAPPGPGGRLAAELPAQGLAQVCEHARSAVLAEASHDGLGSSAYRECAADVAPFRAGAADGDAVSVLNDCMTLVDELARRLRERRSSVSDPSSPALCHNVVDSLKAGPIVAKPLGQSPGKKKDSLGKAAEAMEDACLEAVQSAEAGIKSEEDAMKLYDEVAPLCELSARKHLDPTLDMQTLNNTVREWCYQLNGRLSLALETGFLFALHPEDAYQQAGTANPYAQATRRQFCERFAASVRKQAASAPRVVAAAKPPPAAQAKAPEATPSPPASAPPAVSAAAQPPAVVAAAQPVTTPAPPRAPAQPPAAQASSHPAAAPQPAGPASEAKAAARPGAIDMLRLLKMLSSRSEWASTCEALVSGLASKEASVVDDQVLLAGSGLAAGGEKGEDVLTFNAPDQAQVGQCANRLKVLAVQAGTLDVAPTKQRGFSALAVSEASSASAELLTADKLANLIDSPWARDACADIAHGFLMARIAARRAAKPAASAPQFCHMYAQDLQALQDAPILRAPVSAGRLRAQEEVGKLRRHKALTTSAVQHKATVTKAAAPVAQPEKAAPKAVAAAPAAPQKLALAAQSQAAPAPQAAGKVAQADDAAGPDDGADFWSN